MSRKEPRNAHATGEKVFWAPKTSLPSAGRFFGSGNVPAVGRKVFWLSKTSLPLAGRFFGSRKRPCRWRGPFQTLFAANPPRGILKTAKFGIIPPEW